MVFLVGGRGAENSEKKNKKQKIKNYVLLKNIVVRGKKVKSSLYHHILFTVFVRCKIFETQ